MGIGEVLKIYKKTFDRIWEDWERDITKACRPADGVAYRDVIIRVPVAMNPEELDHSKEGNS